MAIKAAFKPVSFEVKPANTLPERGLNKGDLLLIPESTFLIRVKGLFRNSPIITCRTLLGYYEGLANQKGLCRLTTHQITVLLDDSDPYQTAFISSAVLGGIVDTAARQERRRFFEIELDLYGGSFDDDF